MKEKKRLENKLKDFIDENELLKLQMSSYTQTAEESPRVQVKKNEIFIQQIEIYSNTQAKLFGNNNANS